MTQKAGGEREPSLAVPSIAESPARSRRCACASSFFVRGIRSARRARYTVGMGDAAAASSEADGAAATVGGLDEEAGE